MVESKMIGIPKKELHSMAGPSDDARTHRVGGGLFGIFDRLRRLFGGYQPEKHYMRGDDDRS